MDQTSITAAGAIDTFLVLLIGIGPKIALVPFLEITASLDPAAKQRVLRKMLTTAATVAVLLMVLGELLRVLLHFTIGSLSIAGGVILLVIAVWMVLAPPTDSSHRDAGKDPMQLAQFPLAVPYLLNPVGIVGLMTISAEAKSLSVFAVEFGILVFVLLIDVVVFPLGEPGGARSSTKAAMLVTGEGVRVPDRRDRRATGPRRAEPESESSGPVPALGAWASPAAPAAVAPGTACSDQTAVGYR